MIYTVGGNTSGGSTLVANGGCVAKKSYSPSYSRIAVIWRPKYKIGEAKKVCKMALKYVGYLEKKSNANLDDFKKNAGYNNFNMFAPHAKKSTGSSVFVNGQPWCDMFKTDMFIRALGVSRAKQLLGGDWSAYTPTSSNLLKRAGAKQVKPSKAKAGDIIFFKNSERICHVELIVNGVSTSGSSTSASSSAYSKKDLIKDVCKILGVSSAEKALAKTKTLSTKTNTKDALVLPVQKYLKSLGYYTGVCDRIYGTGTKSAVNKYQSKKLGYSKPDGVITAKNKMWKSLLGLS